MSPIPMPPQETEMPQSTVDIPLDALAQPDDQEQMQTPAEGDVITFTVEGKVTAVNGDVATVTPISVNGKPLQEDSDEEEAAEPASLEAQETGLRDAMANQDEQA